jgi:hypothetical protein
MSAESSLKIQELRFNGADYVPDRDDPRLSKQIYRVWNAMYDEKWKTLGEISLLTGDPEASISAQLRHLRKKRFGSHTIERRHITNGLYEYRHIKNLT